MDKKAVSPVIAIVLLLMMTVAAAGAAYFWLTQMQSGIQEQSTKSIENIMQSAGRRLIAQAAICEPTVSDGLVGWYEFEETDGKNGSAVLDSSENNNKGILHLNSTTQDATADGKAGKALEFDGSDDYVEVPYSEEFDFGTGNFTISIFLNIYDASIKQSIFENRNSDWDGIWVQVNNKIIHFNMMGTGGTDNTMSASITGGYHVVTLKRDSSGPYIYIDGSEVATGSYAGVDLSSHAKIRLGLNRADGNPFNGIEDEVRFYDRALSAEEINETYKGKMKVRVTVRNIGSVSIPEAKFVANLKKDGTTVDSDTYVTESSIDTGDLKTLTFYFNEMRPGGEGYTISIPGIGVSQTVKCQSLE